jgi:hypothetical protein
MAMTRLASMLLSALSSVHNPRPQVSLPQPDGGRMTKDLYIDATFAISFAAIRHRTSTAIWMHDMFKRDLK